MKTLDLENCGMQELHHEEMKEINGGMFSWLDTLGAGLGWDFGGGNDSAFTKGQMS